MNYDQEWCLRFYDYKFMVQFFCRLVEEEEISCEVKAEFKEKTKVHDTYSQRTFHINSLLCIITLVFFPVHWISFLQESNKLQKTIKGHEEEIQRLKEAIEFRDNFLAVSWWFTIHLYCSLCHLDGMIQTTFIHT